MIVIRVISHQGKTIPKAPSFDFDEMGGTIGRAETNQLVLEDNDRVISRVQARVVFRNGGYELLDQGANPVIVNGRRVGNGASVPIKAGDHLEIGAYRLEVSNAAAAAPALAAGQQDPLGLMASASAGDDDSFADIAVKSWPRPEQLAAGKPGAPSALPNDPLGLFQGFDAAPLPSYRDDEGSGSSSAAPGSGQKLIPDDYDPFADPFASRVAPSRSGPDLPDLGLGLTPGQPGGGNLDSLFGLDAPMPAGNAYDPFAGNPLGETAERDQRPSADPLEALGGAKRPAATPDPVADHVPAVNEAFTPPRPMPAVELPRPDPGSTPTPQLEPAPQAGSGEVFFSWENNEGDKGVARTMILAPGSAVRLASEAASLGAPVLDAAKGPPPGPQISDGFDRVKYEPSDDPTWWSTAKKPPDSMASIIASEDAAPEIPSAPDQGGGGTQAPAAVPAGSARTGTLPAGDTAALAAALAKGLGLPELPTPGGLTPELMERMGTLLRESTQGTLDLLLARAMTKREVHADVTMIIAKGNNPLKFSPDVTVALTHLLNPLGRGFLGPEEAMRDAFNDLRAHSLGFVAGMRAAVEGLLKRFGPDVLERRLTEKSVLDTLLPMNRRAKLWDLYQQLYRNIAEEAEEDFHAVLGREFLRAYEEQVALLSSEKQRR